jgi:hypothetical protein
MRNFLYLLFIIVILISSLYSFASGMRYLTREEFPQYNQLLKEQGYSNLKTIVAVYDDSFNPLRVGLKCVNKNGQQFQVYIIDGKIKKVEKVK